MGAWLDWLKNQKTPDTYATKPTSDPVAGGFVGFVAYPQGRSEKFGGTGQQPDTQAANEATPHPDSHCWPHSSAWNISEIKLFNRRAALFVRRGASDTEAERLADALVQRDRDEDDRYACMECRHLLGHAPWRCGNWQVAGIAIRADDAGLARSMAMQLQRCPGFAAAGLPATAPPFVAAPKPPPAQPRASSPDRSPDAPWRELDRAYLAHYAKCTLCQCAGQGYGARCTMGAALWADYLAEFSI